ncbi:MAG: arsenate reductase (glutaredoxin) [Pseudomonadales bacterium]|nr:arsenate reductase (glutaredoxin) [Pseudomonadales bacterium]
MDRVTLWHNPDCSKSRAALALLRERSIEPEIVAYLDTPPTKAALEALLAGLGCGVDALVRNSDALFSSLGLEGADDAALLDALVTHPQLLQRPILVLGDRAVIGRPPERILDLLAEDTREHRRA